MPLRDARGRFSSVVTNIVTTETVPDSGQPKPRWTQRSCTACTRMVLRDKLLIISTGRYCRNCVPRRVQCADCHALRYIPELVANKPVLTRRYEWESFSTAAPTYSCPDCVQKRPGCTECGKPMGNPVLAGQPTTCTKCTAARFTCMVCHNAFPSKQYAGSRRCLKCKGKRTRTPRAGMEGRGWDALETCEADQEFRDVGEVRKWNRLFGIELEMEVPGGGVRATACKLYDVIGDDAILKGDGSLRNGIEMATRPMTFHNHIQFWNKFDKGKPEELDTSSGRCGLHIHVSRKSLTKLTIGKLGVFMNDKKNKKLIMKVARRYNTRYAGLDESFKLTTRHSIRGMFNMGPSNTVEFRVFKGTMSRRKIFACLEFTKTLIEFCEQASYREVNSTNYEAFIKSQPKLYSLKSVLFKQEPHKRSTEVSICA